MDKTTEYKEWIKYGEEDISTAELLNKQHRKMNYRFLSELLYPDFAG